MWGKGCGGQGLKGSIEGGDSAGSEKWFDFRGILKIETRGFADRWDMGVEVKEYFIQYEVHMFPPPLSPP